MIELYLNVACRPRLKPGFQGFNVPIGDLLPQLLAFRRLEDVIPLDATIFPLPVNDYHSPRLMNLFPDSCLIDDGILPGGKTRARGFHFLLKLLENLRWRKVQDLRITRHSERVVTLHRIALESIPANYHKSSDTNQDEAFGRYRCVWRKAGYLTGIS